MPVRPGRLLPQLVAAACVAGLVVLYLLCREQGPLPVPPGWTLWPEPGATLAVVVAPDGTYAGGTRGLFRLTARGPAERITIPGTRGTIVVSSILVDGSGTLWVGHNQGLSVRTSGVWQTLSETDGIPSRYVTSLAAGGGSAVWVGTTRGAVRLPCDNLTSHDLRQTLTQQNGLPHDTVSTIAVDREGGVWFGTSAAPKGGLGRLKHERWQYWTPCDGLPHSNIVTLLQTRDGRIWAGCGALDLGGTLVFGPAVGGWRLEQTIPGSELASPHARSLLEDHQGRLWIGSETAGLTIREGDRTIRIIKPVDGLPSAEIMSMAEGLDGAVWMGTPVGAIRIDPGVVASLLTTQTTPGGSADP